MNCPTILGTLIVCMHQGLEFEHGQGCADRFMVVNGNLGDINSAISTLKYIPDQDFNTLQHREMLTIAIYQAGSMEAKVRSVMLSLNSVCP